jgi:transcriptional regulator with PAS, ATPase and Fis domain
MVADSTFRQDLLFRINTIEINLPPLRERKEDIKALINHFLKMYAKKYKKEVTGCTGETISKLEKHIWPGNVRELQHSVERAVIMSESKVLQPGDFLLTQDTGDTEQVVFDDYNLEEVEKMVIRKALKKHEGNISKAADELGLTRASLYRRMDKYGL